VPFLYPNDLSPYRRQSAFFAISPFTFFTFITGMRKKHLFTMSLLVTHKKDLFFFNHPSLKKTIEISPANRYNFLRCTKERSLAS